jgi:hypothetical protein
MARWTVKDLALSVLMESTTQGMESAFAIHFLMSGWRSLQKVNQSHLILKSWDTTR